MDKKIISFCFVFIVKLSESEASENVAALLAGKLVETKVANHTIASMTSLFLRIKKFVIKSSRFSFSYSFPLGGAKAHQQRCVYDR